MQLASRSEPGERWRSTRSKRILPPLSKAPRSMNQRTQVDSPTPRFNAVPNVTSGEGRPEPMNPDKAPNRELTCSRGAARLTVAIVAVTAFITTACSSDGRRLEQLARADSLLEREQFGSGLAAYRQILAANSKDAEANRGLGAALVQLGALTQAYHFLLKAQALQPTDPNIQFDLGLYYLIRSDRDLAREKAQVALEKDSLNIPGSILFAATSDGPDQITRSI